MATLLYRIARLAFRRRRLVAVVWLILLIAGMAGAATLSGQTTNTLRVPGTEAQRAIDALATSFPESGAGRASARVVFAATSGAPLTDPARRKAVSAVLTGIASVPQVAGVVDPFSVGAVSGDSRVALTQVTYEVDSSHVTAQSRTALAAVMERGRAAGLTVEASGDALAAPVTIGGAEVVGVAIAAVILLITFRSVIMAGLPLITALIGTGIGMAGILILTGFVDLSQAAPFLAVMIGLAVAIDYALLIVSRYRHELGESRSPEEAVGRAVGTAGTSVTFAGLVVVIALAGLSVLGVPFLTQMGLGAAGTVMMAVLIAVTLLPALIGFAGRRITAPKNRGADTDKTMGLRWVLLISRRPAAVLVIALTALAALSVPMLGLRLGLPDDGTAATNTTQRKAYDLTAGAFGAGSNGPLLVVVSGTNARATAVTTGSAIKALPNVTAVSEPLVNKPGDTVLLQVVPGTGPTTEQTTDLVHRIRDRAADITAGTGARIAVTGQTAVNIDMSSKLATALIPYLILVVGLALLVLLMVFRSILVPVKATVGFLLTLAGTFGAVVAVFQWGWLGELFGVDQTGPIAGLMPVVLIGIVFGLAIDYEVFIVSRIREEYVHGATPTDAVVNGFGNGARVVTAAALIMASVFGGFVFAHDPLTKMIGFGLAVAVLVDAFVVRMTIVPAVLTLLGRAAWWLPNWLNRLLPNIDIEGDRLTAAASTSRQEPEPQLARD
jgi:RND superfamily putative drug exporter